MYRIFTLLVLASGLSSCATLSDAPRGLSAQGSLMPCVSAPRCVSSLAEDAEHAVAPLLLTHANDESWASLLAAIEAQARTQLIQRTDRYAHFEISSPWGWYTDDLELLRQGESAQVDVRSAARLGYYDFQVNRKRVETLRELIKAQAF